MSKSHNKTIKNYPRVHTT